MACGLSAVNIKGRVLKQMAKRNEPVHFHLCRECEHEKEDCASSCMNTGTVCLYQPKGEQSND